MPVTPWSAAALGGLGYVVGGVPAGWLLVRWRSKVDIREVGTGNIGTANIYRNAGPGIAALVGPLQFAQGLAPVLLARSMGAPPWLWALTGMCAVIGNGWPVYMGMKGGRGVAVATGAVAGLGPVPLVTLLAFYLLGLAAHRIAAGVLAGFVAIPILAYESDGGAVAICVAGILAVVLARRLEGVLEDLRDSGGGRPALAMVARRLLLDERPGQRLVGPNPAGAGARHNHA